MSDFKRKIEIVEATTPPPNKYNWWFDLNTNQLKRYKNGNWEQYNYTWSTTSLPSADEIWLDLGYCNGKDSVESDIKTEFSSIGTVLNVEVDMREDESALVKIIFDKNLTNITATETIALDQVTDSSVKILFPNLDSINYTGDSYLFTSNGMGRIDFVFGEIKSISGTLAEIAADYSTDITIYSRAVPTIQSYLIDASMYEDPSAAVEVFVPSVLIDAYKSSTNWAQYDIKSID